MVRRASPAGVRQGLRDLGYVEGHNIAFDTRFARGQGNALPALAADLVSRGVDVILVMDTPALEAARRATKTIPIVMAGFGDPVGEGFVAALARPGGNIMGVSWLTPEASGKQLQLLKEIRPLSRVALLLDPTDAIATSELKAARAVLPRTTCSRISPGHATSGRVGPWRSIKVASKSTV